MTPCAEEVAHAVCAYRAETRPCYPWTAVIYVQAKGFSRWFHHVTVSVTRHCVDALTGASGHSEATYLETYFDFPESHATRPVEPDEWETL